MLNMKASLAISLAIKKALTETTAKIPKNLIILPANTSPHSSIRKTVIQKLFVILQIPNISVFIAKF